VSLQIHSGVPRTQRKTVAKIFYESFQDKFARIFGDPRKATELIARIIREDRILVALIDGQAVGFAGLHYNGTNLMKFQLAEIVRIYGLSTIRVLLYFLITLLTEPKANQLHLEVLVVQEQYRNQGIGTKLLRSTIAFAEQQRFSQIRLEVVNTNPKAKKLYERMGFRKVKDHKIPYPFNILTGFSIITDMEYTIKSSRLAS
jgi:ribosomal protein S18 acetylase RimI-like enzyme